MENGKGQTTTTIFFFLLYLLFYTEKVAGHGKCSNKTSTPI